ncbi:hypothetical protein Tco_0548566 [Tanacetum coccineum]
MAVRFSSSASLTLNVFYDPRIIWEKRIASLRVIVKRWGYDEGITSYGYGLKIVSSGWSFGSAVLGQMSYLVASLTLDSARNYVM